MLLIYISTDTKTINYYNNSDNRTKAIQYWIAIHNWVFMFCFCAHSNTLDVWVIAILIPWNNNGTVSTYSNFIFKTKFFAFWAFALHFQVW